MSCTSSCPTLPPASKRAHCGACHETFGTVVSFDLHRRHGECALPKGMHKDPQGVWRRDAVQKHADFLTPSDTGAPQAP